MTLKQVVYLERVLFAYLHAILKRLLKKIYLDACFMCLSRIVGFRYTFNDLCCCTQRCGLLSCIQLRVTDQNWQANPNESGIQFEVNL